MSTSAGESMLANRGWLRVDAPAKVNLRLEVLGRRSDGFHELATAMLTIGLVDRLYLRPNGERTISLEVVGEAATADVPRDGRNLVWRGLLAGLEQASQVAAVETDQGFDIVLEKRVPSRAGLGGGSSDAAAVLRGLAGFLSHGLEPSVRHRILAELGSDTVFFDAAAHTGHAWCFGRGEQVEPVETGASDLWIALLVPTVEAPTAEVFGALDLGVGEVLGQAPAKVDLLDGSLDDVRSRLFNGLERAALEAIPELARWRQLLDDQGAGHFHLSGSGSSFFGLFADRTSAEAHLDRLCLAAEERELPFRLRRAVPIAGAGVSSPIRVDEVPTREGER